ncbi:MAG: Gfo/Idh/MocA family oxidoreductase [Euryarchaeota archaeon]|nr:Gfo/Idh/MocA family oxidoreductase [Euryarchaeota archaeon]
MKVIVIGTGVMGKNHARVLSALGYLSGVVDVDEKRAKEVASRFNVPWAKSPQELNFDAAVIATPTETHYELARALIEQGKHVLVEKPFTHSIAEGEELIELAKEQNIVLGVGHIERFNPIVSFFKKMNRDGNLITIGAKRVSSFPSRIRDVGVIMDIGVHDIDVLRYLVAEVAEVYARGGKIKHEKYEDHASILLGFKNGKNGYIETNWLTPKKIRRLWLTYDDCYAEGDYIGQWVEISSSKMRVDEFNVYDAEIDLNIRHINLRREEPLKRELVDFLGAIENHKAPLVTGADGLMAIKIAQAALRSLNTGRSVEVD